MDSMQPLPRATCHLSLDGPLARLAVVATLIQVEMLPVAGPDGAAHLFSTALLLRLVHGLPRIDRPGAPPCGAPVIRLHGRDAAC